MVKSERLRGLREKRGLSQVQAAKKMGIVRTTYSNYESGNRQPDNDTLRKMADFFEVSTDYLLGVKEKANILEEYSSLPPEKKKLVDDLIKALLDDRVKK